MTTSFIVLNPARDPWPFPAAGGAPVYPRARRWRSPPTALSPAHSLMPRGAQGCTRREERSRSQFLGCRGEPEVARMGELALAPKFLDAAGNRRLRASASSLTP